MQTVSQSWIQEQQKKVISAESFVELKLIFGDPTSTPDASTSDNGHESISGPNGTAGITGIKTEDPKKYATLEDNLWVLDGTYQYASSYDSNIYNGYIGDTLSDSICNFNGNVPTVTISFSKVHTETIPGITITWGSAYEGEYAERYNVKWYNGNTLVESYTISDNKELVSVFPYDIKNYDKIVIEILKWSKPYHRARISHIMIGVERTYTKNDIFKYSHTMFVSPLSAELPKSEITFQLKNLNGEYNPDNLDGVTKYFLERQTVHVRYGYKFEGESEVEWIKAGKFFLSEWDCPQNGITATLTARDALEYMSIPYTGPAYGTLMSIALAALRQADMPKVQDTSDPWILSSSLSGIVAASDADLSSNTVAEVLQYVAHAACCVFFQDRDGIIHIEPLRKVISDYKIDPFNSYENAEISLTKQLKAVDINDGQFVLEVGGVGEIQKVNNPLISSSQAPVVAKWVADHLKERRTLSGSFRADPRLDALDCVTNKNQFSQKTILVTQIEYSYNGAFRGSYEGRTVS